jgi:hypothetical protein
MTKDYAGATYNEELRYTTAESEDFGGAERAQFLLALGKGVETFTANDVVYYYVEEGENIYRILELQPIAEDLLGKVNPVNGADVPPAVVAAYENAKGESFWW